VQHVAGYITVAALVDSIRCMHPFSMLHVIRNPQLMHTQETNSNIASFWYKMRPLQGPPLEQRRLEGCRQQESVKGIQ
jgi:hypothetical protein